MPAEQGYQQQAGPARPTGLPQASADSFGAQVGGAVAQLGATVHETKLRAYQQQRQVAADTEQADFQARFADARDEAQRAAIDARNGAAPGGAGHADAMGAWWEQRATTLLDGITDDRVRRAAAAQVGEFGGRFTTGEYEWQEGARVGHLTTNVQRAVDVAANRASHSSDPLDWELEQGLTLAGIDALHGVPEDVRDKLRQHATETITHGYFTGLVETHPEKVGSYLDGGKFDAMLSPEQQASLRNQAEAQINANNARARAVAAAARAANSDTLETQQAVLETGADTPADWDRLAAGWEAAGEPAKAVRARAKGAGLGVANGYNDAPLGMLDAKITELTGKQRRGGLTPGEAVLLDGLSDKRRQQAERLNQPGGALAQEQFATGQALPPLNPADPQSMAAYGKAAVRATARWGGAVEPIPSSDIRRFKALMSDGPDGQFLALDAIRHFGNATAIVGAARQITGDDAAGGAFRIAASLPEDGARSVLNGSRLQTAGGGAIGALWKERGAVQAWNAYRGVLAPLSPELRGDLFNAARAYYLDRVTRGGEQAWDDRASPGKFAQAIEAVLGRNLDPRTGVVRGGLDRSRPNAAVVVPPDMTGEEMNRRFARGAPDAYLAASGGRHPTWADGHPMTIADFRQLLPTRTADGRYGFRARDGGWIHAQEGGVYTVDVHQLPGR